MESTKVTEEMEGRAAETSAPGTEIQILMASGLSLFIWYFHSLSVSSTWGMPVPLYGK